jgi:hypothetical protein
MPSTLSLSKDLPICSACGAQYAAGSPRPLVDGVHRCRICEDPRQYVPPSGQEWSTLGELIEGKEKDGKRRNVFEKVSRGGEQQVWEIWTEPKVCQCSEDDLLY